MTHPERQEVPSYVAEASYRVARAVEIGALAIGVARHADDGEEPMLLFEIAEVTEPGVGQYATSAEAEVMRTSYQESGGLVKPALAGSRQMFADFLAGIKVGDFEGLVD